MSELERIFLTSGLTILGGIIVLVLGQLVQRFFIEPIHEQARVIGEIAYSLAFYAPVYSSPSLARATDEGFKVMDALRGNASRLIAATHAIRWYWLYRLILWSAPPEKDVLGAVGGLFFLSNSLFQGDSLENSKVRDEIVKLLRIRTIQVLRSSSRQN